ncbi:hypothetical protein BB561_004351 [Smittium simulii]|uniref:Uncharacterized protein n=1 Tax=Smittium simulii TaxID=133385 RepID=A0A2T9YGQ5_9FUNG|nr:hypothetical protein BB561_004351 [Smittium simulii]
MSATRCKPLQQVVDAATRTLAKCGKSATMVRLGQELSLADLIKYPCKHRCDTWVSGCIRTYWTARRYAKFIFIEKRFIEECIFCRNIAPETIEHMLLESQVATKPPLLPASISMRLVGKLLGEELKLSSTRIRKDPTVLCVKTTLVTAEFLNAIAFPRYLMLNSIRLVPIPANQCSPGTEILVSQRRVNR